MFASERETSAVQRLLPKLPGEPVVCFRHTLSTEALSCGGFLCHQLLFVTTGQGRAVSTGDKKLGAFDLSPGTALVIPPQRRLHVMPELQMVPLEIWTVSFHGQALSLPQSVVQVLSNTVHVFQPKRPVQRELLQKLHALQAEMTRRDWATPAALRLIVEHMLISLVRENPRFQHLAAADADDVDPAARVHKAVEYIEANLTEPVSLKHLAKLVGVTARHLSSLFKKHTGMTVTAYRNLRRVEKAKELLAATDKPITDVAFEVGFGSLGQFYEFFKRYTGTVPSTYRDGARRLLVAGGDRTAAEQGARP